MTPLKLSIILPCYNVEKYIAECLDSLYTQDIPETEYEVICVNDCSPDGTREIIVNYQETHPNLILIDHKVNKRQGGARNTGLKAAKGEYIWFVDPDDYIKPNVLNSLLNNCFENDLDILLFNHEKVSTEGKSIECINLSNDTVVLTGVNLLASTKNIYDLMWLPFKLFKLSFLDNNSIRFLEFNLFEDLDFTLKAMCSAKKTKSISDYLYLYRYNPNSTSNTIQKRIVLGKVIYTAFVVIGKRIIDISTTIEQENNNLSMQLKEGGIWRINRITRPLLKASNEERTIFYNLINNDNEFKKSILCYLNPTNRFLINHEKISKLFISILIYPALKLIRKI